jgi:hypothetical protein
MAKEAHKRQHTLPAAVRATVDIHGLGALLGPDGKPWSRNTVRRRMAADKNFPKPIYDGYREQWYVDEALAYKATWPRRQHYEGSEAGAA